MGLSKTEIFTEEQNRIANFAKALGHPARIAIIEHLFKIDTCVCGDLVNEIGLAQPTISQHLKAFKNLEIIQGTVEGTSVCYCINPEMWQEMYDLLEGFLKRDFSENDKCC